MREKAGSAAVWCAVCLATTIAAMGAARAEDQEYGYEYERLSSHGLHGTATDTEDVDLPHVIPHDIKDSRLTQVRWYVDHNQFRKAFSGFQDVSRKMKMDKPLIELRDRLELSARSYPELAPIEQWEVSLSSSLRYFCYGRDPHSMLHASYSLNLNPQDMTLENYVNNLEKATQLKAERLPPDSPRDMIGELLHRAEDANNQGNFDQVRSVLNDVLELEPNNLTALERLGTVEYELGRFADAIKIWERATALETKPSEVAALRAYIKKASQKLGQMPPPTALDNLAHGQ